MKFTYSKAINNTATTLTNVFKSYRSESFLKDVNFFTTPVAQKILSWCSILLEISALHLRKCIKYKYTSCIWHKNEKCLHMECIRTYYGELFFLP